MSDSGPGVAVGAVSHPLLRDQVRFGFGIAPGVNAHLQRAAIRVSNREDSPQALNDACQAAPDQLEVAQAVAILETMAFLDPDDLVGAHVIRDLLEGMDEARDDG